MHGSLEVVVHQLLLTLLKDFNVILETTLCRTVSCQVHHIQILPHVLQFALAHAVCLRCQQSVSIAKEFGSVHYTNHMMNAWHLQHQTQ